MLGVWLKWESPRLEMPALEFKPQYHKGEKKENCTQIFLKLQHFLFLQ
jgi:hypothetical protein